MCIRDRHCTWVLKSHGCEAVIVNNNPETVSTDFDTLPDADGAAAEHQHLFPVGGVFRDKLDVYKRQVPVPSGTGHGTFSLFSYTGKGLSLIHIFIHFPSFPCMQAGPLFPAVRAIETEGVPIKARYTGRAPRQRLSLIHI